MFGRKHDPHRTTTSFASKPTSPIFRSQLVTRNNRFVTTLQQSDIRVREDGVEQQLFTFTETDRPLSIAFLIDISQSEERTLPEENAPRARLSRA